MGEFLYQYMLRGLDGEGKDFVVVFSFTNGSTEVSVQPYLLKQDDVCISARFEHGAEVLMMNNFMSKGLAREHWNSLLDKGFARADVTSNFKFNMHPMPPMSTEYNLMDEIRCALDNYMSTQIDTYEYTTNYALEA
jgi:hypothetical protein